MLKFIYTDFFLVHAASRPFGPSRASALGPLNAGVAWIQWRQRSNGGMRLGLAANLKQYSKAFALRRCQRPCSQPACHQFQ